VLVGAVGVIPTPASASPATQAVAPADDLVAAVQSLLRNRTRAAAGPTPTTDPQVTVSPRTTDEWGFGSAVLPALPSAGAYPEGWLFVARRDGTSWTAALEGEPLFADIAGKSPILTEEERQLLGVDTSRTEASVDRRTGMRLPFALGQTWRLTGGPHPMNGSIRSSIDLAGGDGRVLAARAGIAYTMCSSGRGWIRVIHDRGFATDYYHLSGNISANGRSVKEGEFLGRIGNDVSCGGTSTGPHVHFSLRKNNAYISIDRYQFGKWVIRQGAGQYQGYALHGSKRVNVGGGLYNYGVLGFREGIVDTDGGRNLNRRKGPGTNYPIVAKSPDGASLIVTCSARGTSHTGRNGYTTNLWNRLSDGTWVNDAFLWTGTGDPVNGYCP